MLDDQYYMRLVLDLAKSTVLQTLPNPHVAAVVVKEGRVLGIGCHLRAGDHHAEVYALHQAGSSASGATLYVNLEPCVHYGKTPPCVDAIIKSKIKRVVIANLDENPLVAGNGIAKLEQAGIEVQVGVLAENGYSLNKVFFHNINYKEPFVTLKVGMSLDGKIATHNNISQWITSHKSRLDAHYYRVMHNAILVGVGTVIKDNPSLTAHLLEHSVQQPIRIILDTWLRTPLTAKVIQDGQAPTWIYTTVTDKDRLKPYQAQGVKIMQLTTLELTTILHSLYANGIYSVLVEGGEQVYASFIESRKVKQLVAYLSPQLIGSPRAKHFFAGNGFGDLDSNLKLKLTEMTRLDDDVKLVYQALGNK